MNIPAAAGIKKSKKVAPILCMDFGILIVDNPDPCSWTKTPHFALPNILPNRPIFKTHRIRDRIKSKYPTKTGKIFSRIKPE